MAKEKKFFSFSKNPIDFTLLITVIVLLVIGLIMVLSASSPTALSTTGDSYRFFVKQLLFAVMGVIAMMAISKIDYRKYFKYYKIAYIVSIVMLALVLIMGKTVNNAKRWIYITNSISFQPSEMVKFLMIIFYAAILTKNRDELGKFGKGFFKHLCLLAPIIALLMLEPHFSVSVVIMGICAIMMIMAGCKF